MINLIDKILDRIYSDKKEKAPNASEMFWRPLFHLSPSYNLFYYVLMGIFIYFINSYLLKEIGSSHYIFNYLQLNTSFGVMVFSILLSVAIIGTILVFVNKIFNQNISIPSLKKKAYIVFEDAEFRSEFVPFFKKKETLRHIDFTIKDNNHIDEDILEYQFVISDFELDEELKKELNKYNITHINLNKYDDERITRKLRVIIDVLKYEAPSLVKGAVVAQALKLIPYYVDVLIYKISNLIEGIAKNTKLRAVIIALFFYSSLQLFLYIAKNNIIIPDIILLLISTWIGRYLFNFVYYISTQIDNLGIVLSNLVNETIPLQKLHYKLKEMNSNISLSDWYNGIDGKEGFKHYLDNQYSSTDLLAQTSTLRIFDIAMTSLIVIILQLIRLVTFLFCNLFGYLSVKHARVVLYFPVQFLILSSYGLQLVLNIFIFKYASLFFMSLLMSLASLVYIFETTISHALNTLSMDYSLLDTGLIVGFDFFIIAFALFMNYNVFMIFAKGMSIKYYKGYTIKAPTKKGYITIKEDGVLDKYVLNWRKGIAKSVVIIGLVLGLIQALFISYNFYNDIMDNNIGYNLSSYPKILKQVATDIIKSNKNIETKGFSIKHNLFDLDLIEYDLNNLDKVLKPQRK